MNNIQFSLPEHYREKLAGYSQGDSLGKTAKRLLIGILDGSNDNAPAIEDRLSLFADLAALENRVYENSSGIKSLERRAIRNGLERFGSMEDRLSALESRLSALEGDKQETAIMIQKRTAPAPVIPEITYSHEQAATEWKRTTATVKRWASKPEKWPQGWLFDSDKQFWVRTA